MEIKRYILEYVNKMKPIQQLILNFLENEEADFQTSIEYFDDQKIRENKQELQDLLHLISKISNNHHRSPNFFIKIEHILKTFQDKIKIFFPNFEIFHIFKNNKRILLFLFEEEILIPDKSIFNIITKGKYKERKYPEYFFNEFKNFYDEDFLKNIKLNHPEIEADDFESNRKRGENNQKVCKIIQNDLIDDFIVYRNQTNLPLSALIENHSIFESNNFLLKKRSASLIEYSAFFGSIRIFNYLILNQINLTSYLWPCAIHGNNAEIIQILEEKEIKPIDNKYEKCYIESVKCHHIEIMYYLKENYFKFDVIINFKYFNFTEICEKIDLIEKMNENNLFYSFCKYDYLNIVDFFLNNSDFISKKIENWKILFILKLYSFFFVSFLIKFQINFLLIQLFIINFWMKF